MGRTEQTQQKLHDLLGQRVVVELKDRYDRRTVVSDFLQQVKEDGQSYPTFFFVGAAWTGTFMPFLVRDVAKIDYVDLGNVRATLDLFRLYEGG